MKTVRILAVAAVATSLACSEGADLAQIDGPEFGRAPKPIDTTCDMDEYSIAGLLLPLCQATNVPEMYLSNRNPDQDRGTLLSKLNDADIKCEAEGKTSDTIGKITQFRDKVLSLRAQGKILEPFGVDLAGDAQAILDAFDPELTFPALTCPTS